MKFKTVITLAILVCSMPTSLLPVNMADVSKWAQQQRALTVSPDYIRYPDKFADMKADLDATNPNDNKKAAWATLKQQADDVSGLMKVMAKQSPKREANWLRDVTRATPAQHTSFLNDIILPIHQKIDPTKNQDFEKLLQNAINKLQKKYKDDTNRFDTAILNAFETEQAQLPIAMMRKHWYSSKTPVRIKGGIEGLIREGKNVTAINIPMVPLELYLAQINYLRSLVQVLRNTNKIIPTSANGFEKTLNELDQSIYIDRLYHAESLLALAREIVRDCSRYLQEKYSQEAELVRKMGAFSWFKKIKITATDEQKEELEEMMIQPADLQKIYQRFLQAIKLTQLARAQHPKLDYEYYFNVYLSQGAAWKLWIKRKLGYDFPTLKAKFIGVRVQAGELSILTTSLGHSFANLFEQMTRYVIDRGKYLPQDYARDMVNTLKGIAPHMISAIQTYLEDYKFWIEYLSVVTRSKKLYVKDINTRIDKINARIAKIG